jgi:hypothetical protein
MSSSRHSTVTFNGTPLENTANSLASIDTPVRAMAKVTIGDDLGVSDVPRQICQRSVETQHQPLATRQQREHCEYLSGRVRAFARLGPATRGDSREHWPVVRSCLALDPFLTLPAPT